MLDPLRKANFPFNTIAAVTEAVRRTWTELRDVGRLAQSVDLLAAARRDVLDLVRMQTYLDIEARTTEKESPK